MKAGAEFSTRVSRSDPGQKGPEGDPDRFWSGGEMSPLTCAQMFCWLQLELVSWWVGPLVSGW